MNDEPTIEEELDIPTQIGYCVKCTRKVMSGTDYVLLEDRSLMCEPCVDKTISEVSTSTTQSGKVTRRSASSTVTGQRTVAA